MKHKYSDGDLLQRLEVWFENECNEDWEHSFGIKIETLDNPGWLVTIDLTETSWHTLVLDKEFVERNERDWLQTEVVNKQFIGCGGVGNLNEILEYFFEIVDGIQLVV